MSTDIKIIAWGIILGAIGLIVYHVIKAKEQHHAAPTPKPCDPGTDDSQGYK